MSNPAKFIPGNSAIEALRLLTEAGIIEEDWGYFVRRYHSSRRFRRRIIKLLQKPSLETMADRNGKFRRAYGG